MKKLISILLIILTCFPGFEERIIETWEERDFFSADITRLDITPIDTVTDTGNFILANQNFLFDTETELIAFANDTLYTYSQGSDVGVKSPVEEFVYADISVLISRLREDFELGYIPSDSGLSVVGNGGKGNVVRFRAILDDDFLPERVSWVDIFDNEVVLIFDNISTENKDAKIKPPQGIEFILE